MKNRPLHRALGAVLAAMLPLACTQAGNFSYHGTLQDAGKPADGRYDIELTLYSAANGGSVVAGPLTLYGVDVRDGHFSAEADFAALPASLSQAWVGTRVSSAGANDFVALDTRVPTEIGAAASTCSAWALDGNAGNPAGSYLGTADNQPLIFKVNNIQLGKLASSATDAPAVAFGSPTNQASGAGSTVAGGGRPVNYCGPSSNVSCANVASGTYGAIGGGRGNTAGEYGATIAGGGDNTAYGRYSFIAGSSNTIGANGTNATIGGGDHNSALGAQSTIPGGSGNIALGQNSFAAGYNAYAFGKGSFVWADASSSAQFGVPNAPYTNDNVFLARATGGVYLVSGSIGSNDIGVKLSPGAGSWSTLSDRTVKTAIVGIDPGRILDGVLAMPVSSWQYVTQKADVRHIGPMAQDFFAAFHIGEDERHISTVDEGGVALAAIQGLNQKLEKENAALKAELHALSARVDVLTNGAK